MISAVESASDRVYLDHNATSPLRPEARRAIEAVLDEAAGNPASLHAEGRAARAALETSRARVADLAGMSTKSVVFTSGGSEAIEAGIRGVCDRAPASMRRVVVTRVEHSAVLEAARSLTRLGFHVEEVPCDREGRVDAPAFLEHVKRNTALAVVQWANNETGVLQPVEDIGRECRARHVPFLVDAVQAAGKIPLHAAVSFADFMALSSHKLGGPQGVGALAVRDGIVLAPLIHGGNQERRRRGGTPGIAAIAGFGAAAEAAALDMREESGRVLRMRARIETRLRELFPDVRFHGQAASRLPNTVNFALPGVPGDLLAIALDMAGFAVSTGSACASGAVEPSHVLQAMGYDEAEAAGALRVSLGWSSRPEDAERFLDALPDLVKRVRDGIRAPGSP